LPAGDLWIVTIRNFNFEFHKLKNYINVEIVKENIITTYLVTYIQWDHFLSLVLGDEGSSDI